MSCLSENIVHTIRTLYAPYILEKQKRFNCNNSIVVDQTINCILAISVIISAKCHC